MTLSQLSNIVNTHIGKKLPLYSCSSLIDMYMKNVNYKKSLEFSYTSSYQYSLDFNLFGYRRIPIYEMGHMEMMLLEWKPGSFSPIHAHHDNGCIMVLLENNLTEKRYCTKTEKLESTNYLPPRKARYIDNSQNYHSIFNECNNHNALSLHIYPK